MINSGKQNAILRNGCLQVLEISGIVIIVVSLIILFFMFFTATHRKLELIQYRLYYIRQTNTKSNSIKQPFLKNLDPHSELKMFLIFKGLSWGNHFDTKQSQIEEIFFVFILNFE
jgi:hypothetical protein